VSGVAHFKPNQALFTQTTKAACDYTKRPEVNALSLAPSPTIVLPERAIWIPHECPSGANRFGELRRRERGRHHPIHDRAVAGDAVDRDRRFEKVAVLVEPDVPEDPVVDSRSKELSRHRRARAVGTGDRVEEDLRRLRTVRSGLVRTRPASGGVELPEEPPSSGRELAVRDAVSRDVHAGRGRPGGLDQAWEGVEADAPDESDLHGWSEPEHLACAPEGPNSPLDEQGPSYVTAGGNAQLYFSRSSATVPGEIYVAPGLAGSTFGPAAPVSELNDPTANDIQPNVRKDGREVVFSSNRTGGIGGQDIWVATRESVDDPWSAPVNLGASVNTAVGETRPSLSWRARTLLFGRAPGPEGMSDIYVATRGKLSGAGR
jgi:hypothetical protein